MIGKVVYSQVLGWGVYVTDYLVYYEKYDKRIVGRKKINQIIVEDGHLYEPIDIINKKTIELNKYEEKEEKGKIVEVRIEHPLKRKIYATGENEQEFKNMLMMMGL